MENHSVARTPFDAVDVARKLCVLWLAITSGFLAQAANVAANRINGGLDAEKNQAAANGLTLLETLRHDHARESARFAEVRKRYKEKHPRYQEAQSRLAVLGAALVHAEDQYAQAQSSPSAETQATAAKRNLDEVKAELVRERSKLATLKIRYKEKHPRVVEQSHRVQSLESYLVQNADQPIGASDPLLAKTINQLDNQIAIIEAQIQSLETRYLDGYPKVREAKNRLAKLKERREQADRDAAKLPALVPAAPTTIQDAELLKEELALVTAEWEQMNASGRTDSTPKERNTTQIELLRLQEELALKKYNLPLALQLLKQEQTLLKARQDFSHTPRALIQLKRDSLAVSLAIQRLEAELASQD